MNCPKFIAEFRDFVSTLNVKRILEVGSLSCELKDAVGADGIDINAKRGDVVKVDIRDFKPGQKYDLVFSSGLLEHYDSVEAVAVLKAMVRASRKYVLTYVPNSDCKAYMANKQRTRAEWKDEDDYTEEKLDNIHRMAGLKVVSTGTAAAEWSLRFGAQVPEPYLVWCLAVKTRG